MSSKETILNIPNPPNRNRPEPVPPDPRNVLEVDDQEEEEFCDEDEEGIGEFDDGKTGKLTLGVLLQEGLIEPADGVMSIDYLGQTFKGDLLPSGKIKSVETGLIFNNPSAWAIYCKQIVNPAKKSGCGWASVKYRGRKMDHFKNLWLKMKSKRDSTAIQIVTTGQAVDDNAHDNDDVENESCTTNDGFLRDDMMLAKPAVFRHCQLAPKHPLDNLTTLIDVETFQEQGKIQPFTISISSSASLLIDLHSHLNLDCVCGYLAGQWDFRDQYCKASYSVTKGSHNLAITHVFPCLTDLKDTISAEKMESKIYNEIYGRNLTLVGWYRSCPGLRALPSLKDTEAQLEYQMKLLGPNDATYTPCVGLLASPYTSGSNESEILVYWVAPPAESCPNEYGKPLKMVYSMVTDPCLSQEVLTTAETLIDFYKTHPRVVSFRDQYNSDTKYITKMGRTLLPKFPRDQDERLWKYIRVLILESDDPDIEDPLMIQPPMTSHNGVEDEDEIDDDEENALHVGSTFSKSSSPATKVSPPVSTEEVISMLLQQQSPVVPPVPSAPPAHQISRVAPNSPGPLDFSTYRSGHP